jgi:hypothetical protein
MRRVKVTRAPDLRGGLGPWAESQPADCGDAQHARFGCECYRAWRENPHRYGEGARGGRL